MKQAQYDQFIGSFSVSLSNVLKAINTHSPLNTKVFSVSSHTLFCHCFVCTVAMLSFCISYLNRLKNQDFPAEIRNRTTFILLDCSHGEDVNVDGNITKRAARRSWPTVSQWRIMTELCWGSGDSLVLPRRSFLLLMFDKVSECVLVSCCSSILPQKFFPHLSAASLMDRTLPCFLSSLPLSTIFLIQCTVLFFSICTVCTVIKFS